MLTVDGIVIRLSGFYVVCYSEVPGYLSNKAPSTLSVELLLFFGDFDTAVAPISGLRLKGSIVLSIKPRTDYRNLMVDLESGVITRGLRGRSPLVKTFDHFGGSAPLKILALALLFKVH